MGRPFAKRKKGMGGLYQRKGSDSWYSKVIIRGKAQSQSTCTTDRQKAEAIHQARMVAAREGRLAPTNSRMTVNEVMEKKLLLDRKNGRQSIITSLGRWNHHLKPFFGSMKVRDITENTLAEYQDSRMDEDQDKEVAPASVNRELGYLRAGLNIIPEFRDKLTFPMLKEPDARMGWLEDHEIPAFAQACMKEGEWFHGLAMVSLEYAWRRKEVRDLKIGINVDFRANLITLEKTKNGESRTVAMTEYIRGILLRLCQGKAYGDWVFTRPSGDHVYDYRDAWERAVKAINHKDLIFHDLRRTGACRMVEMGVPQSDVMWIAGWTSLTMLLRYLKARGIRGQSKAISIMNEARRNTNRVGITTPPDTNGVVVDTQPVFGVSISAKLAVVEENNRKIEEITQLTTV